MKRDTVNYTLVGIVVLGAFAMLLVTLFIITGRTGPSTTYHVHYSNVTGLGYGAPVFYEGFRIGQVSRVTPLRETLPTRYRVEVAVRSDWSIPVDSIARLQSSGLLADVSIGIREGQAPQKLAAGAEIIGEEGGDIFAAMNDLAAELTTLTRSRLAPLVDSLANRLESLTGSLDDSAPQILADTERLLTQLNVSAQAINQVLGAENRAAISGSLADVRLSAAHMREVAADLTATQRRLDGLLDEARGIAEDGRPRVERTLADLEDTVGTIARRIEAITHHLEASSRNFEEFSREIRRNPNRLLFAPPADTLEVD
jgi:phospholipid/cholesterol/gamma-HCH transport system substrate-binding protein